MHTYFKSFVITLITACVLTSCGGCGGGGGSNESDTDADISLNGGSLPSADMALNFTQRLLSNKPNLFAPIIDKKAELYIAHIAGKPLVLPLKANKDISLPNITTNAYYTQVTGGIFVDSESDPVRWFSYHLKTATTFMSSVVYQVARHPFHIKEWGDWEHPRGLIGTGTLVKVTDGEFSIDFSAYDNQIIAPGPLAPPTLAISQPRKTYYVRVVSTDFLGKPIGDPGEAIMVIYGKGAPDTSVAAADPAEQSFQLYTPEKIMGCYKTGEFECYDAPQLLTEVDVQPKGAPISIVNGNVVKSVTDSTRLFSMVNLDPAVYKVTFQVSDIDFGTATQWNNVSKLVYEKTRKTPVSMDDLGLPGGYTINDNGSASEPHVPITTAELNSKGFTKNNILLDFSQFAKTYTQLGEGNYYKYYVRAIAFKKSAQPGTFTVSYSNTVKINYIFKATWSGTLIYPPPPPPQDMIRAVKPQIRITNYVPIKFEDFNYMNRYIAFRAPRWDEINITYYLKDSDGNIIDALYPLSVGKFLGYYDQNLSEADYEENYIKRFIVPGSKVYFPPPQPKKEDDSFWGDLWEIATGFFTQIVDAFGQIYTAVQTAYNDIKTNFIAFVVNFCPVDGLKDVFSYALSSLVDAGMLAAGVPPSLPNLDQLVSGNLEYLAATALSDAGVPASDIIAGKVVEIADEMREQVTAAMNHGDPNPAQVAFLKLDPDYLYRPAYVDVEIKNLSSQYPSVPGTFDLNVTFDFGFYDTFDSSYWSGIFLVTSTPNASGWMNVSATSEYRHHFFSGLNGDTCNAIDPANSGSTVIYDLFKTVQAWKFPRLKPGETTTARIYLEEYYGIMSRYPNGENQVREDFYNMYFNSGEGNAWRETRSHFSLNATLMTPQEYVNKFDPSYLPPHLLDGVLIYHDIPGASWDTDDLDFRAPATNPWVRY